MSIIIYSEKDGYRIGRLAMLMAWLVVAVRKDQRVFYVAKNRYGSHGLKNEEEFAALLREALIKRRKYLSAIHFIDPKIPLTKAQQSL